jgi:hypothetical protein
MFLRSSMTLFSKTLRCRQASGIEPVVIAEDRSSVLHRFAASRSQEASVRFHCKRREKFHRPAGNAEHSCNRVRPHSAPAGYGCNCNQVRENPRRGQRCKKNSASSMSPGVVIFIFLDEPITTQTSCPERSTNDASSVPIKPSAAASSNAFFRTS